MFDTVLGRGVAPKTRWGVGTIVSVALHVGVLALAVYLSTTKPEEAETERVVTFVAPPPPPPPPKGSTKPRTTKPRTPRPQQVLVQPVQVPVEVPEEAEAPPAEEADEEEEDVPGVEGGVKGGVEGGVVGGVVGGTGPTDAVAFSEGMQRPQVLHMVKPAYTQEALHAEVQGRMVVRCVITPRGTVEQCRILKPLPYMEKAALDALSQWRFTPIRINGRPARVDYTFTIRLELPNR